MRQARVLCWDIETTSLKADFGFILCIGYKFIGDKSTRIMSIGDFTSSDFRQREKQLVGRFVNDVLNKADISVTHNGQRYDHTWINAKCLEYDIPLPKPILQVDTLTIAWKHLRSVSRKRLDTLSYYLGTADEKTPVEGRIWVDAALGKASALKYIIDHCRSDVNVLEEVYLKVRGLLSGHPRIAGAGPCRYCGSTHLQKRGLAYSSAKGTQYQVQCQDCGGWEKRPLKETWSLVDAEAVLARTSIPTRSKSKRGSVSAKQAKSNRRSQGASCRKEPVPTRRARMARRRKQLRRS